MTGETAAPRVFIVSKIPLYRDGLRLVIEADRHVTVVGAAADCVEALQSVRKSRPDVLLLDLAASVASLREALTTLAYYCAPGGILLLSPPLDQTELVEALRCGVRGVVMNGA